MQQNICIKYLQTYNIPGATGFKYHERPSTAVKNVSLLGLHPNLAEGACTGWPQTWKTWIRDLSEHGKLVEFSGNSVQPQGKLTLCSGCSLCQAIRMHPHKGGEASSPFSAHFYSGQTAGCIKMLLGMEVGLGLPPYQVASCCMQPFGHKKDCRKVGGSALCFGEGSCVPI